MIDTAEVFAYCTKDFKRSVREMAGVEPLTCPPYCAFESDSYERFDPKWLEGRRLIYIDLHGEPETDYWYEEIVDPIMHIPERIIALTGADIRSIDLSDTVVFALSCYLGEDDSPMLDALLDVGATVIAAPGKNYASQTRLTGAALLGLWFRKLLLGPIPAPAHQALRLAKNRTTMEMVTAGVLGDRTRAMAARDTLEFRIFTRGHNGP